MNGGMQRCFHIINQLSLYFDLTVITFQSRQEFLTATKYYPAISKIKLISTKDTHATKDIFSLLPQKIQQALRYRWLKKQLSASADGMFLEYYPALTKLLKASRYDAIVLENLTTLNAISVIRKHHKKVKIIYDAHNVDSNLARKTIDKLRIRKIESSLHHSINALFVCSDTDRAEFDNMNNGPLNVQVIPNGVEVDAIPSEINSGSEKNCILFCGSLDFFPNSEGLLWFYKNIWKQLQQSLPDIELIVVGCGQLPAEARFLYSDPSILFSGKVENVKPWYQKAKVSIVPLLSGSGTRLKILEAMSLGLPVIATAKGAEGIDYTNGENIIIADDPHFFEQSIVDLLSDSKKRTQIQSEARKLVEEEYDWNKIGVKMKDFLLTKVIV
jgi:glycosyltransferase involved in cell wall biosynthesis